jgi:hypothetical protein
LGGMTSESLFDRETLVGTLLIGLALLLHGGFESSPNLSPQSSYRGYVYFLSFYPATSWNSIPNDRWIFVDGTPSKPSRQLHLIWARANTPPESLLKRDYRYDLTFVYRSWDLRVISIHALPDPYYPESGLAPWHWFAPPAPPVPRSFFVEAGFGAIVSIFSILQLASSPKGNARTFEGVLRSGSRS